MSFSLVIVNRSKNHYNFPPCHCQNFENMIDVMKKWSPILVHGPQQLLKAFLDPVGVWWALKHFDETLLREFAQHCMMMMVVTVVVTMIAVIMMVIMMVTMVMRMMLMTPC